MDFNLNLSYNNLSLLLELCNLQFSKLYSFREGDPQIEISVVATIVSNGWLESVWIGFYFVDTKSSNPRCLWSFGVCGVMQVLKQKQPGQKQKQTLTYIAVGNSTTTSFDGHTDK